MNEQAKKNNLLFFLNSIMIGVLDSMNGSFGKSAKYKFGKVVNSTNQLEKELLRGCCELSHETYNKASLAVGALLNKAIDTYNDGDLAEFVEYCEKFKKVRKTL